MRNSYESTQALPKNITDQDVCHRTGNHCGSTATRDILEFHGLPMTEAMCLGLGGGLGVTYSETPFEGLPYIVHVRSMGFASFNGTRHCDCDPFFDLLFTPSGVNPSFCNAHYL